MATLITCATGNFTSSSTWAAADATSLQTSESANTSLTTSYVESSSFTPGAITIDGIAVKIASVAGSPTGTISVRLAQGGSLVAGTEVTINVTDLPTDATTTNLAGGFILFKFSAPVTLAGATAYTVSAKTSSSSQVNLFRNATSANWSRMLRTTTTQAPAAGDNCYIIGEHTGAATGNSFTMTVNNTTTTVFGTNLDGGSFAANCVAPAVAVGKRGTVTWGISASTAYVWRINAPLVIYSGGTWNQGTSGSEMPRTSTGYLQFDSTGAGKVTGYAFRTGATVNGYGLSRTSGKTAIYCRLNGNAAANATTLNVDTDTGWLDNDIIVVAGTIQGTGQNETGALNGNAGASSLTVDGFAGTGGGVLNAHLGTSPIQAEVVLATRNVGFYATNAQAPTGQIAGTAVVNLSWFSIGQTGAIHNACTISTTTGSFTATDCYFGGAMTGSGVTFNNVTMNRIGFGGNITIPQTSNTNWTLTNAWGAGTINFNDLGGTGTDCVSFGGTISFGDSGVLAPGGTIQNFVVHSGGGGFDAASPQLISNITSYRNSTCGWTLSSAFAGGMAFNLSGVTLFGNAKGINRTSNSGIAGRVSGLVVAGDTTYTCAAGLDLTTFGYTAITFESPQFSPSGGIYTPNTVDIAVSAQHAAPLVLNNPIMGGTTQVSGQTSLIAGTYIGATRLGQVDGVEKSWFQYGTIEADSSVYHTAAPSQKLTPNNASGKLQTGPMSSVCADGATLTFSVWVKIDSTYAGSLPRLILQANGAMGTTSDTVLATAANNNSWQQLTGTTSAALDNGAWTVYVDCGGTAGFINVDDWSVS